MIWMRVGLILLATPAGAACGPGAVEFPAADARFAIEIADTASERATGLMHRDSLGAAQGMLFVYDAPGHPHFWMKDTLIALDMLFIGPDGTVLKVADQAQPLDENPIDGGDGVQYVLEIKGGQAQALGLAPGTEMRWPGLGAGAVLSCN